MSAEVGSLGSGVAITLLGTLLLLQEEGTVNLDGGWLLAGLIALAGAALIASGSGARGS